MAVTMALYGLHRFMSRFAQKSDTVPELRDLRKHQWVQIKYA